MLKKAYTSVRMKTLIIRKALKVNFINGETLFKCLDCYFKVLGKKNMEEHFRRVYVNLEAICVHCEYKEKSFEAMIRHFETNHMKTSPSF